MKKILAFSGSNSSESINQKLLQSILPLMEKVEVELIDLRNYPAEVFSVDIENESGFPQSMQELFIKMRGADGFLISVPEHNGSMPAVFKNSIDWISRMGGKIFNLKPTVFLSASPGGRGGASVLEHLNRIMPHRGAEVIGSYGVASFHSKWENNKLNDETDMAKIKDLIQALENRILENI